MKKIVLSISTVLMLGVFFLTPLRFDILNTSLSSLFFGPSIGFNVVHADAGFILNTMAEGILFVYKLIIFDLTTHVAAFAGWFLDFFLKHSITSSSYRTGLTEGGWEIIRDLVNIVFIFSLIVIAFQKVFGNSSSNTNKRLMKTIVVALIINFSLYGTYLIVDSSNILANLFYNRITVEGNAPASSESDLLNKLAESNTTSISAALMSHFNPQRIAQISGTGDLELRDEFILYSMAGILNIVLIIVFFSVAFVFLSRTIVIMLLGVLAPLALITLTLPGMENKKYIGFNNWFEQLLGISFTAPVFLFFLFIIIQFASSDGFMSTVFYEKIPDGQMLTTILAVAMPFAFIAMLLLLAKKITMNLAGELGGMITSYVTKAAAGVAAVGAIAATGGAAAAGALSRGAAASGALGNGRLAQGASSVGKLLQTAKFDLNKIPGFKKQLGGLGAAGDLLGRGMNTSYADAETSVRRGANNLRAMGSNFASGRTPESVANWQNNVQASRDSLMQTRLENQRRLAQENLTMTEDIARYNSDGTVEWDIVQGKNTQEILANKRADLARMSSQDKKDEKKRIDEAKAPKTEELQIKRNEMKKMTNVADRLAAQEEIKKLEKEIEKIENSSVEGTIKQLEKKLETAANDAQATTLANDNQTRNRTQDSSMTISESRRQERTNTQAARVTTGQARPRS